MTTPKADIPAISGRELRWWFRGCLVTFVFSMFMLFMLSSLGMAVLMRAAA